MSLIYFKPTPNQVGDLVLRETGGIIYSGGDLENDERRAEILYDIFSVTDKLDSVAFPDGGFNKISIYYKSFCYLICRSNKKIHIVKRLLNAS